MDGGTLQLTADGKTAVCGLYLSTPAGDCTLPGLRFLEYTIAKGKPRSLYQLKSSSYGEGGADSIWASPSGATLIGNAEAGCGDSYSAAGIIANGTLTPLRFPAGIPFAGEAAC